MSQFLNEYLFAQATNTTPPVIRLLRGESLPAKTGFCIVRCVNPGLQTQTTLVHSLISDCEIAKVMHSN